MKYALTAILLGLSSLALPARADDPPKKPDHPRVTWQQHFANANKTGDGHLTPDQAKAGYPSLFKHFPEIDTAGKGFVTIEDVKAWHKQPRDTGQRGAGDKLRPRHAVQRGVAEHPAVKASTGAVVPGAAKPTDGPG